jgi:hypothetical protein
MQQSESAMDRLEQILTETAAAIRLGNLTVMGKLATETELALAEIGPETDAARFTALRDQAGRNAMALQAAAKGVRAARRRLTEVMSARAGVQTYDQEGNTRQIGGPAGSMKARF